MRVTLVMMVPLVAMVLLAPRETVVSLDMPELQELLDPLDLLDPLVHLASMEIAERLVPLVPLAFPALLVHVVPWALLVLVETRVRLERLEREA